MVRQRLNPVDLVYDRAELDAERDYAANFAAQLYRLAVPSPRGVSAEPWVVDVESRVRRDARASALLQQL